MSAIASEISSLTHGALDSEFSRPRPTLRRRGRVFATEEQRLAKSKSSSRPGSPGQC
jgi:hypothetical protein